MFDFVILIISENEKTRSTIVPKMAMFYRTMIEESVLEGTLSKRANDFFWLDSYESSRQLMMFMMNFWPSKWSMMLDSSCTK